MAAKEFAKIDVNAKQILADMFVDMSIDAGEKLSTIKEAGVLDQLNKNTAQQGGKQYKLGVMTQADIQAVQIIGRVSVNAFSAVDIKATERFAQQYWKEMGVKSPFFRAWFCDWRVNDQTRVQVANKRGNSRGVQKNIDTGWNIQVSGKVFNETKVHTDSYNIAARPYLPFINDIVQKAILLDSFGVDPNKPKSNNSLLMHSLYAVADVGNGPEVLKLYVEEINDPNASNTTKRAYQLQNVEKYQPTGKSSQKTASSISPVATGTIRTVADLFAAVKRMDADFQPKPASKIVNADGTPKVMYHGSPAQFTIFDKKKAKGSGQYGRGFYFTNSQSHAGTYGQQYSVYLNIRNPLESGRSNVSREQVRKFLETVAENEDYSIENYGTYDVDAILDNIMGRNNQIDAFRLIQDVNATAIGDMVEAAELFNKVNGTKFDGIVAATETVAFYPNQIKSATDNIGTFDGSNLDIRYKVPVDAKSPTYEELVAKGPIAVIDVGRNVDGLSYAELKKQVLQNAEARKLFDVPHLNSDTEISIFLTPSSFTHAFSNLTAEFGVDTILAMDHIDEILHEAILTHIDDPKNPAKAENRVFTFFAAIEGENGIEPIKLKVKEYVEDNVERLPLNIRNYFEKNGLLTPHNRLYDAVALEVIAVESAKKESGASASGTESETQSVAKGTPNSTIKIADLLGLVNGGAKKYIPNRNDKSLKLPVGDAAQQRQAGKETLTRYQEALRGQREDTKIMEQEFARLARAFETQARRSGKKDVAIDDLKAALKAEAKKHRADQKLWEAEFNRLLRAYETSGRKIDRLEAQVAQKLQAAKDKVESRRKTEMRHKIIRFKEKLQNTLQRPTENSYVPVDLICAMVDVCELIDNDSPLYKTDGSLNKAQAERDATRDRLIALKDEYSKLKASDPIYAGEFDEMVEAYLDELRQNFTGKSLKDMSLMELGEMYEILRSIAETLQDARKLIDFGENADVRMALLFVLFPVLYI